LSYGVGESAEWKMGGKGRHNEHEGWGKGVPAMFLLVMDLGNLKELTYVKGGSFRVGGRNTFEWSRCGRA